MNYYLELGILIVLIILFVDWLWIHGITGKWMSKLWVLITPALLYRGWQLLHTEKMHEAFLSIGFVVFGIAYLLTGLNKFFRRPYR